MSEIILRLLMLAGIVLSLSGETPPWYLHSHYPDAGASDVPTNTSILLDEDGVVAAGGYTAQTVYSLKSADGTVVPLKDRGYSPVGPLAPNTHYIFTITPPSGLAKPYSFEFTTGTRPDTTGPVLLGFDPPSGSS